MIITLTFYSGVDIKCTPVYVCSWFAVSDRCDNDPRHHL